MFQVAWSIVEELIEAVLIIVQVIILTLQDIVTDQDCQLTRFQALKVKVLPEKVQLEAENQVNQAGKISVIIVQVELLGPKLE